VRSVTFLSSAWFLMSALPSPLFAAWQPNGIPVAPVSAGIEQFIPNICTDGSGGAYVTWKENSSTDYGNAYLQRVTAEGDIPTGWSAKGIRIGSDPNDEFICNLAADMVGGAYVVWWTSSQSGLLYRLLRVLPDGTIAPGWPAEGLTLPVGSGNQQMDDLCGDGKGGIYIVWTATDNEVFMLHYTANGEVAPAWSSVGRRIIAEASTKGDARIIPTVEGGFLASWNDLRGGRGTGFFRYALNILPSGDPNPGWPPGGVRINSLPTIIEHTAMISDGAGGAYIGWNDNRNGVFPPIPLDYDIYGQHVLGNGTVDSRWPADGLPIAIAPSAQYFLDMAEDREGGALIVWDDYRSGAQIYASRIRPDGSLAPGWTLNGVRMAPRASAQTIPQAVGDFDGGVYGFWEEVGNIIGQHLDGLGVALPDWTSSGKVIAGGGGAAFRGPPGAINDGKGGALIVYERLTATKGEVYIQRVYRDVPVPTLLAFLDAEVSPATVRLRWTVSDAAAVHSVVFRRQNGEDWSEVGEPTLVGGSVLEFNDRDLVAGRYEYCLGVPDGAFEALTEGVFVDIPSGFVLQLSGFRPNPAVSIPSIAFTLPDDEAARIDVFDVKGRVVSSQEVGKFGAGRHVIPLSGEAHWSAGVYWIRLTQRDKTFTSKGLVAR
jgi:hypothetical protein